MVVTIKQIKLSNGDYAIVDPDNFHYLSQWAWSIQAMGYAERKYYDKKSKKTIHIMMHRVINGTPDELVTDHINRIKLDNRRCNLRSVTQSQNNYNRPLSKLNTSGYCGVFWDKYSKNGLSRLVEK